MIKRLLFISAITIGVAYTVKAQCTIGPAIASADPGTILPDSATGLPPAYAGNPSGYITSLDIKTLTDTTATVGPPVNQTVALKVYKMKIHTVKVFDPVNPSNETSLPSGFTYAANAPEWVNGGTSPNLTPVTGCVAVSANQTAVQNALNGGPANDGVYPLRIYVDIQFTAPSLFITNPTWISASPYSDLMPTNEKYRLRVLNGTSIIEENNNEFKVVANIPNPFSKNTEILFTMPADGNVNLKVYNMLGKEVYNATVAANQGDNRIPVSAEKLASGVYLYTLSYNNTTITKKMIVEKN
ncbi:MAG: T9SS type A sorting domain-containing protein [Bacteroidia bacterium]